MGKERRLVFGEDTKKRRKEYGSRKEVYMT